MAETEKAPTITDVKNSLSNACGGYAKMYHAAYAWCGGDYKAKSRAMVLTAIIDYVASKQKDIKPKTGENPWYLFTDSHWQERLQMDRGTMKTALDWLEKVGVIGVRKFGAGKGEIPKRHISLDLETLVTLIRETQDRGPEASKVKHPRILDSGEIKPYLLAPPKKETPRGEHGRFKATAGNPARVTAEVSAVSTVKFPQGKGEIPAEATAGNSTDYLREVPQGAGEIPVTKNMLDNGKMITKTMVDDIAGNCSDVQQIGTLATHAASGVDLLRKVQDISLVSGNEQQQPKPSETKETQKPPVPNLPEEEKRTPSVRAAAIAFPKTSQFLETIKGRMVPLSSSLGEPWGVLGFDDRGSIAAACSLDWKYAVRRNDLKDLVLAFPGCPIEYWDIWESETDDEGKPIPAKDRTTDHGACIAAVQAWLEYAETKGLPDPWQDIAGKDRETEWPKHGAKIAKDAPSWEDRGFREYFKSAYQELRRTK